MSEVENTWQILSRKGLDLSSGIVRIFSMGTRRLGLLLSSLAISSLNLLWASRISCFVKNVSS
uniref:Uncharacterized protein n=1 Tax=Anguilla anguilla TaxID=7936 RepID=A0A0E9XEU6_ANGAN